ncbi:MAG TPA: DUF885 domain-containing protein [Candidatus Polarisedimenticolia bacterium]
MIEPDRKRAGRAAAVPALLALLAPWLWSCSSRESRPVWSAVRERYFIGVLKRDPVTCTYLGGDGYSPELAGMNARLPDITPAGRAEADAFYRSILGDLDRVDPAALGPDDAIDREVVRAQIGFLLHQEELRAHERSVDTYVVAPFRGVDWQIQQMADLGGGRYGRPEEWDAVAGRVEAVPAFLRAAEENLRAGIAAGNLPDARLVQDDGIQASRDNAAYFRVTLPDLAAGYLAGQPARDGAIARLRKAGEAAAAAFEAFASFLEGSVRAMPPGDRYAAGESEYNWRLVHCLKLDPSQTAATLFDYGQSQVDLAHDLLIAAARRVAEKHSLRLDWSGRPAALRSARRVMDELSRDYPKDDAEMFRVYRAKALELVDYARRHGMFDLPSDYRLEIVETPPVLGSTIDAAYYPAPPFKSAGIGRFYLSPSRGDLGVLKENNLHAVADLCAHEGFPGHDWHYQFMRGRSRAIGNVRWLTVGEVEGSASMWGDSMAAEGWALYAEQLMAEPQSGAPDGFYTPEERIYQIKGQLLRAARIRLDIGLHTGRMSFDEAVAYYAANVDLLPDACDARSQGDPVRKAACNTARRAIYRYSKWPTQAITYHLGKKEILDLRDRVARIQGDHFSLRGFHERFLAAGTIPAGYFRDRLLDEARR